MAHVHADLMRSACFQGESHKREALVFFIVGEVRKCLEMSDSSLSVFAHAKRSVDVGDSRDGRINDAGGRRVSFAEREIMAFEALGMQVFGQAVLRVCMFGEDDKSACLSIEAVDGVGDWVLSLFAQVVGDVVAKRAVSVAATGVHHNVDGFVYDEQVFVFVGDVEAACLGLNATLRTALGEVDGYELAFARYSIGSAETAV